MRRHHTVPTFFPRAESPEVLDRLGGDVGVQLHHDPAHGLPGHRDVEEHLQVVGFEIW